MPKSMGYLLPSGDAYTDEHACMMLFYPDKPEYRRALFGALDYFSTWLAWERDPDKKGQDAAKAWREAIEATRECIEMNACETILALLEDIKANTGVYCCETADITDGDQYTDAVEDGEGNVPQNIIDAGYATGTSDWAGFAEYKCMISHVMITNMYQQTLKFLEYTDEAGAVLGGAAALAAILAAILATGGTALVLGIVLGIASAAGLYAVIAEGGESALTSLANNLDDNHDALACAIYNADGSAGAVVALKAAIDAEFNVAEATILKNYNLAAQLKALYAGRYDAQDIAEKMADEGYDIADYDCSCLPADESYLEVFLADEGEYTTNADAEWRIAQGNPVGSMYLHYALGVVDIAVGDIQIGAGLTPYTNDIEITHVTLDYWSHSGLSPRSVKIIFEHEDRAIEMIEGPVVEDVWTQLDFHLVTPITIIYNAYALRIRLDGGTGSSGFIDNIRIWFNVV